MLPDVRLVRIGLAMVAWLAAGAVARAQPVHWSGPDECPAEADVIAEIERLLGGDVDWSAWESLGAEIVATPADGGWRVVVTTKDPEGVREVVGASCAEVAQAAALVVAMTIDPDKALAAATEPKPEPETRVESTESAGDGEIPPPIRPAESTEASAKAAAPRRARLPIHWGVRAEIISDLGSLPGVKPGAGLTAAAMLHAWRLELSGIYWFQRRETLDEAPTMGGDISLLAGSLRGCYQAWGFDGCAGLELGRFSAHGFGSEFPESHTALWLAPTAGLARRFKVSTWFSFSLLAEAGLPLQRPRFWVDDALVHQPAPVVGRFLVGGEVALQ